MQTLEVFDAGTAVADPLAPYAGVSRVRPDGGSWVMANMVTGLDGSAAIGGRVGALSTAPDAELFRSIRALADVVLVGAQTVRAEGYSSVRPPDDRVAAREAAGRPGTPALAVVSRSLDLNWPAAAFSGRPGTATQAARRTLVITSRAADPARLARARDVADVLLAGEDLVDLAEAIRQLGTLGHRVVLCEGGPTLLGGLVAAGRLDELCLSVAPLMGGDPLPVAISPPGVPLRHFALRHVMRGGDTLFLRYEWDEGGAST